MKPQSMMTKTRRDLKSRSTGVMQVEFEWRTFRGISLFKKAYKVFLWLWFQQCWLYNEESLQSLQTKLVLFLWKKKMHSIPWWEKKKSGPKTGLLTLTSTKTLELSLQTKYSSVMFKSPTFSAHSVLNCSLDFTTVLLCYFLVPNSTEYPQRNHVFPLFIVRCSSIFWPNLL